LSTANEGATKHYSFTTSDLDDDTFALVTASCGLSGVESNETFTASSGSGSFDCAFPDGPKFSTVSVRVKDSGNLASNTSSIVVTVANVAPVVGAPGVTYDPITGVASVMVAFTDPGINDSHTGQFNWTINGTTSTSTGTVPPGGRTMTGTRSLLPGCYTISVTATVTDNAGDSHTGLASPTPSTTTDIYSVQFQSPIKDNARNLVKYGNVVPVKVVVYSNCSVGTTVTSPQLFIQLTTGSDGGPETYVNAITESVSAADTGQQMRISGNGYIYNLSTKGLTASKEYAVRVKLGSIVGPDLMAATLSNSK
jgi:hypothetical protein